MTNRVSGGAPTHPETQQPAMPPSHAGYKGQRDEGEPTPQLILQLPYDIHIDSFSQDLRVSTLLLPLRHLEEYRMSAPEAQHRLWDEV